ncbi:MAG: AMP-binding enzyme, partial [Pseudonocardiales bacterium]|nr:AMP-binding enzyme [Pseudonocardiales bacterium]
MAAAASDTYPALVRAAAVEMPDRVFLHCSSELTERDTVTFGELELRSRRVAAGLLARGLGPGDRIAVAAA